MDNRRPTYTSHPPPQHPVYPQPYHAVQQHPQQTAPVDTRPPPPTFAQPQPLPHAGTPSSYPNPYNPPPPPAPQPGQGPALPPIQATPQQSSHNLPSLHQHPHHHPQPPPPPAPHEAREPPDYHQYSHHNRSGHATPAPVNRSYSHDSAHQQQHTPTTPAQTGPGPYPPASAPDGAQLQQQAAPQHMDHGHHGYPPTNGLPHAPPPQLQPGMQQHHEPPPPHHMTPVGDPHYQYPPGPPPPAMYTYANNGPASSNYNQNLQKRKQMRATQACEQCRQRKQKCDEGNPCSFCKEQNLTCQYRDTPPAKTDKNMEKLMQYMESHTAALTHITNKMDDFDQRLRRVEQNGFQMGGDSPDRVPSFVEEPPKQVPLLDDHRTAPQKLILLWPSVKPLLRQANIDVNDSYVIQAEDRGIPRLWSRGEGIDEYDGTQPGGPASPAQSEDSGDVNAPSPPYGIWGTGFPPTPVSEVSTIRSEHNHWGGLKADGTLDLDVGTINSLFDSYMRNMHIMHPFLDGSRLRKLFDQFIKRYSTSPPAVRQMFAVSNSSDGERPLKRQRSNGSGVAVGYPQDYSHTMRREPTERSPANAIVWLVLALGKICLHKEPLPSLVPDKAANANTVISHGLTGNTGFASSPVAGNIRNHHPESSPASPYAAPPHAPSIDGFARPPEGRSRRSSVDATGQGYKPRNLDVVPGLAYYAKAAEILGDQGDGNDLVHAQMFLLAGLYKGQLARVKESMSWYSMAGRALRMLLDRYKLYNPSYWYQAGDIRTVHEKGQARIKDKRHNLIVLASWTCLQLESDILAELRLPSSGIGAFEEMLLMPHRMPDHATDNYDGLEFNYDQHGSEGNVLLYYTAQMFLRKRLNQVHKEMYGDHCLNLPLAQVQDMLNGHENILHYWRQTLPDNLQWNDNDPPATNILDARLRAKYWGARYVVNRPFLDYALHIMPLAKDGLTIESVAKDCNGNPREKAEIHMFKAIKNMGEGAIWTASKRCIEAAMQSTVALDGVPERLIVTNIHGTAHAQFGNMLVLSAAHYNNWLKTFVPSQRFHELLLRTIRFLRKLAPISPTCYVDCGILEKISLFLFGPPDDAKHVYINEGIEPQSAESSFGPHS